MRYKLKSKGIANKPGLEELVPENDANKGSMNLPTEELTKGSESNEGPSGCIRILPTKTKFIKPVSSRKTPLISASLNFYQCLTVLR
jgi:hypothetical protein